MKKVLILLVIALSGVLIFVFQPYKVTDNTISSSVNKKDFSTNALKKKTPEQESLNKTVLVDVGHPILDKESNKKVNTELTKTPKQNKPDSKPQIHIEKAEKIPLGKQHLLFEKSITRYENNLLDLEAKKQLKTRLENAADYREMMLQFAKEQMEKTAQNE